MNDTSYKDSIGNFNNLDVGSCTATSGAAINDPSSWITSSTVTNVWAGNNPNTEPSEGDIFKQIVSLLGIKIANVKIEGGKITIYGYRRKKKYIIEVTGYSVIVKNEKGEQISEILLSMQIPYITITPTQPYVYPTSIQPGITQPGITWIQPYTTTTSGDTYTVTNFDNTTGTYTLAPNSNIIENKVVIDG